MSSTQIRKPRNYILGGLGGAALCAVALFLLERVLQAPNEATLTYWQMLLALPVYALLIASIFAIARGVLLAIRQRRYPDERP